jgi:lipopolysaccharide/colanic/teichoic acid biosynthesis glycosyltransferase
VARHYGPLAQGSGRNKITRGRVEEEQSVRDSLEQVLAAIALIVFSPVFAIVALAVGIESGWPVFFRQIRLGRHGSTFQLVKFRSMRSCTTGALVTKAGDSRVTRVGAFLRRYKIDELPQLWNIARGDMQFIGPRPEVPAFVDLRNELWRTVLSTKPGLADPATLVYRDEESVLKSSHNPEETYRTQILPDKLALSARYQALRSWRSDAAVFRLTAWYSFLPAGYDSDRIRRIFEARI